MYWIAKKIKDEDGNVTGYEKPKYKVSSPVPPDANHMAFIDLDGVTHPKMETFLNDDGKTDWRVIEDTDLKELSDKAKEVDDYIKLEASKVFNSTTVETMLASMGSYLLRLISPQEYVTAGLVAEYPTTNFVLGEPLNSAQKIADYYKELLVELDLKRETKKLEYKTLKDSKGI